MRFRFVAPLTGACALMVLAGTAARACPVTEVKASDLKHSPVARHDDAVACVNGFADGYACSNVDLLSYTPLSAIGGGSGNDIWGWTDAATGREYALMGRSNGTAFVDVTVADHPVYLGSLPTHTTNSSWRDIKVYNNHAFIVSEAGGHGMQIFDLTQLRDVAAPPVTFAATAHYGGFGNAHNVAINTATGFAYAVGTSNAADGCNGGLHMVDISDVANPAFAGCYGGDGYTHDAQCVIYSGPDPDWNTPGAPREICFAFNEDTLTIVDVTDKSAPQLISRRGYAGSGYTHQGWITEDQERLLLDDEGDETASGHNTRTYVWNIKNLDAPTLSLTYDAQTAAIDHNLYIRDGFAYQANYRSGLRILDLNHLEEGVISENGFFDIYPGSDATGFNGAWSVYPFFDSGIVVVSGIEQGLYVLRPTALQAPFTLSANADNLDFCGSGSGAVTVDLAGRPGYAGNVTLSVTGLPAGMNATISPTEIVPPASLTLTVTVAGVASGVYPVTITGSDGLDDFSIPLTVSVSADVPAAPGLVVPLDGATGMSAFQPLYWDAAPGAFRYDVDVALDPAFVSIVAAAGDIGATGYEVPGGLATDAAYHWRVRARNACGTTLSAPRTFTTAAENCSVSMAQDVPYNIDGSSTPTVVSTLTTSAGGLVTDVNVIDLRGIHTYVGDLLFRLEGPLNEGHASGSPQARHPERTTVTLMDRVCGSADDFDVRFDDAAASGVPCPPTGGGTWLPAAPLAEFNGVSGSGQWRLFVSDNFPQDGGRLDGWGLEVCSVPAVVGPDSDGDGLNNAQDNCTLVANPDQIDADGDGIGNACDADLNNDGVVNVVDLGILRNVFFGTDPVADFNSDGVVNAADLGVLKAQFFRPPRPSGTAN